jgi:hypothetical protein
VDSISTSDAFPFQKVKNKFLNLDSSSGNGDSAHLTYTHKNINKNPKMGTKRSGSSSSKPTSSSKETLSCSKVKICTWCAKHHLWKANRHNWHHGPKLKEFNQSAPKDKGKGKEQYIARYNLDTDSEFDGPIYQDMGVSP